MIERLPSLNVPSSITSNGLSNRLCWWIKHPQAAAFNNKGINSSDSTDYRLKRSVSSAVFGGTGREPKKTPPLRFPLLALLCGYPIHPTFKRQGENTMYSNTHTPILKRYTGVSINNLINRFSVTAYSLREAQTLLPAHVVVTGWMPVKEVLA